MAYASQLPLMTVKQRVHRMTLCDGDASLPQRPLVVPRTTGNPRNLTPELHRCFQLPILSLEPHCHETRDRHSRALPSNLDKNEDRADDCFNMAGPLALSVVRTFSTLTA